MKNNSVSEKDLQHPTSKYDYDGITGTWLLIPAKFHILIFALLLPIIIWVLPLVHFKGEFRYIFTDYRYYIAGAMAIFCFASAILSIIKAKQVKQRLRPMNRVNSQVVAKNDTAQSTKKRKTSDKHPKVHIGQIAPKNSSQKDTIKSTETQKASSATTVKTNTASVSASASPSTKTIEKRAQKETAPKTSTKTKATTKTVASPKTAEKPKKASATKSAKSKAAAPKKSEQMQLDL